MTVDNAKIGEKIRILREIKGITTKEMSSELDMSLAGYLKIERGDVNVNMEKVEKIASKLGIKPHELLLDEKIVLHFSNNDHAHGNYGAFINTVGFSEEVKSLYEDKVKLLEEKIGFLQEKIKSDAETITRLNIEMELLKNKIK